MLILGTGWTVFPKSGIKNQFHEILHVCLCKNTFLIYDQLMSRPLFFN